MGCESMNLGVVRREGGWEGSAAGEIRMVYRWMGEIGGCGR